MNRGDAADQVLHPDHWLVFGREWPAGAVGVAECATAIAPRTVDCRTVSTHSQGILDASTAFAAAFGHRVVFVADLTRWLGSSGWSWQSRGVDFGVGLAELQSAPILGIHLAMGQVGHAMLCDTSPHGTVIVYPDGTWSTPTEADRNVLRTEMQAAVERDWPLYARDALVKQGKVMFGGAGN